MINTVHDYYMMPFLPLLFIVITYGMICLMRLHRNLLPLTVVVCLFIAWLTFTTTKNRWTIDRSYINPNMFLYQADLKNAVPSDKQCIILNDESGFVFAYKIDKMGHIFKDDYLPAGWVKDMILRFGIRYMYSDSRKVDENPEVSQYIDSLIMQRGDIKVFSFKDLEP